MFNSNGGTAIDTITHIENGDTINAPSAPVKTGHIFGGWFLDAEFEMAKNFNDAITQSLVLFAKWTPMVFDIVFYDVGGGVFSGTHGNYNPVTHTFGTETILVASTREGFIFGGWFMCVDGDGEAIYAIN
ncbi:MAG: InlB B-repeat-containing protein [Firmicutes bacterium]|nr:InlB B-repeat-containing protein [Bacillota bacterium]